ncbi:suppressor of cytokine signaling 3-like [Hydractinia symbiolongicarpus]|uniref:suppressor of cytokine signaling 3-like n=1 Tax=Hydractinia symbiolongicarpus TaxID=13093 RepID=UPI00254CF433|nr:suppressor of cytokine signaling 3-like [Hydractinia symbiolongicarpus]
MFNDVSPLKESHRSYHYRPEKLSSYKKNLFQQNNTELDMSGFYYRDISTQEAVEKLKGYEPGRFLVRDSSSQSHYYTVTYVDRKMAIKSIRIEYSYGKFFFAASSKPVCHSDTVLGLIQTYCSQGKISSDKFLKAPVRKTVSSLKHLSRVSLNKQKNKAKCDITFVQEQLSVYPYSL